MAKSDYPKPPGWRKIGRHYLVNTCPVSRHTRMLADELRDPKSPFGKLMREAGYEPDHWASSLEWTVKSLWEARERIKKLDPIGEQKRHDAILAKARKRMQKAA